MKNTKQKNVMLRNYIDSQEGNDFSVVCHLLYIIVSWKKAMSQVLFFPPIIANRNLILFFLLPKAQFIFFVSLSPSLVICTDEIIIAGLTSRDKVTTYR